MLLGQKRTLGLNPLTREHGDRRAFVLLCFEILEFSLRFDGDEKSLICEVDLSS